MKKKKVEEEEERRSQVGAGWDCSFKYSGQEDLTNKMTVE